ncbi:MAG: tyrosine-type recombinase/integrase [Burkholderiales bacterium]|nr:tyrosine-type recombinase/integrase [Burkholderiales bacterium]
MASVVMLPSGRFRGFARHKGLKEAKVHDREEQALRWAEATEKRMKSGAWTPPEKCAAAEVITLRRAAELYRESDEWAALGERTRRIEPSKQKRPLEVLGDRDVCSITSEDVRAYVKKRLTERPLRGAEGATMSAHAVRLEVAALSGILRHCVEVLKVIDTNPVRGTRRPKGAGRNRRMSDDEIGKMLDCWSSKNDGKAYVFFRIMFSSLCRPGELAGALKTWLRDDPPQISLPRTKNEDPRNILLTATNYRMLKRHLEEQPAACPYLFGTPKRSGEGWSAYNYRLPWDKAREVTEVQCVVPHLTRHEGVSRLFERTNLSDGQIAGLTGHRSPQALWNYRHLRNEHQRGIVNALDLEVSHAVDRAAAGSAHPSEALKPGEMLLPISDEELAKMQMVPADKTRKRAAAARRAAG